MIRFLGRMEGGGEKLVEKGRTVGLALHRHGHAFAGLGRGCRLSGGADRSHVGSDLGGNVQIDFECWCRLGLRNRGFDPGPAFRAVVFHARHGTRDGQTRVAGRAGKLDEAGLQNSGRWSLNILITKKEQGIKLEKTLSISFVERGGEDGSHGVAWFDRCGRSTL